ncbi:MAG: phosphoribosyltransferase family protein [Tannerellaceae bacterium]
MNFKSISDLSKDIDENISLLKTEKFDLVVGVPRSGLLPASIIALKLNLPLLTLNEFIDNSKISHGRTRKPSAIIQCAHEANKILIVDDSINSGDSILEVKAKLSAGLLNKCKFLAVYGVSHDKSVDFILDYVSLPRIFEWNAMYHGIVVDACFDIDGVLCEDPTEEQNDDGSNYLDFLINARPRYLPIVKINTLVTNRLEKYRPQTELWLKKHGVMYDNLEMLNLNSKDDRVMQADYFQHKVNVYKKSGTKIFYESSLQQAKVIFERTKLPVYCVDDNKLFSTGSFGLFLQPQTAKWLLKERLSKFKMLRSVYHWLRKTKLLK